MSGYHDTPTRPHSDPEPALLNRIDRALEQLDLLMDLAAELRHKELQILANQSFNMMERWKQEAQRDQERSL